MKKYLFCLLCLILPSISFAQTGKGKYVGGDISLLPAYEQHNKPYLDENGETIGDLLLWLNQECGWNTFRIRLFVNPENNSDPDVCQDLEYVSKIGKRIKDLGAYFMLDFHYSDTWVDAGHIQAPEAWKNLSVDEKSVKISDYTKESLTYLKDNGAQPDFVQVGNEIMYGFMGIKVAPYDKGDSNWDGYLKVLKAGCDAVRETCPEAEIIIHTDRPSNVDYAKYYYGKLDAAHVDYDVIGLSYYPFWHGTLTDLKTGLNGLKTNFPDKKVQIVECAYYFQYWPTAGVNYNTQSLWSATPEGQQAFINDLLACLADYPQVEGFSYWCPEEAGNGDDTDWNSSKGTVMQSWLNRGLWWPSVSGKGHWPLAANGIATARLLKNFLGEDAARVECITLDHSSSSPATYNIAGQQVGKTYKGIIIQNGRKILQK